MGRASVSVPEIPHRVSVATRLRRGIVGFMLGWVWASISGLLCLVVLAIGYGGLDEGLSRFKAEAWARIVLAGYFGSAAGCVAGSTVGPVVIGLRKRRDGVFVSSALAGVAGGLLAAAIGAVAGWAVWRDAPQSLMVLRLPIYLGVPVGAVAGWLVGRAVGRTGCSAPAGHGLSGDPRPSERAGPTS